MTPTDFDRRGRYSGVRTADPCIQLVACDGPVSVGRVALRIRPVSKKTLELDCAELEGLGVAPSHQRRGIATRLVREAEATARLAGRHRLGLTVGLSNMSARAFYERLGYGATRFRAVPAGAQLVAEVGVVREEVVLGDYLVKEL